MCGINGEFVFSRDRKTISLETLVSIRDAMASRGPDAAGQWIHDRQHVGFGHRRLSIIDLSDGGNQPMSLPDASLTITYNGEIYNYLALKRELEELGHDLRTQSDTEVLLHLFLEFGYEMVNRLRGMFALAIWDDRKQELFLARDPFGIKPLYYADVGSSIRFASQVKALLSSGSIDTRPDPAGHVGFLLWGHVPEPFTLFKGIRQLPAGSWCRINSEGLQSPVRYSGPQDWFARDPVEDLDLRGALLDTVRHHFVSDVPVSVFLSAGRDSSTLVALASEIRQDPIRAVTLAYPDYLGTEQDETPMAAEVARQYGANHTIRNLTREEFHEELEAALLVMDQPSVDGLNTYFVSRAATAGGDIRVALSGLGADEIFGGYPSFSQVPKLARMLRPMRGAGPMLRGLGRAAGQLPTLRCKPKSAALLEYGGTLEGAYLLRRALFLPSEIERMLVPDFAREGLRELSVLDQLRSVTEGIASDHAKVAALEMTVYMRDRLLRDSDWAGMAHSLEIRVPFVDRELLRRIGYSIRSARPPSKEDMAGTPANPLPRAILHRPKTGFTIPIKEWMHEATHPTVQGDSHRAWALFIYGKHDGGRELTNGKSRS